MYQYYFKTWFNDKIVGCYQIPLRFYKMWNLIICCCNIERGLFADVYPGLRTVHSCTTLLLRILFFDLLINSYCAGFFQSIWHCRDVVLMNVLKMQGFGVDILNFLNNVIASHIPVYMIVTWLQRSIKLIQI